MTHDLTKYTQHGHFQFQITDSLIVVCNAPTNKSGVYLVYSLEKNGKELIYIGRSGKVDKNGEMFVRKAQLGGMKDRIVNGHQFGKIARRLSWPNQMKKENIKKLEVQWFVTHNEPYCDCPRILEKALLEQYFELNKKLPRWNNEL